MHFPARLQSHSSGQALLIGITLLAVLIIGISAVFLSNQIGTLHQQFSSQRSKGRSIAEEGIGYAQQQLSATLAAWNSALNGNFTGTDCNTGNDVMSPSGGVFRLSCSTGTLGNPNLQNYEVSVVAVAFSSAIANSAEAPTRAMQAYFSQRTIGSDLATGVHTGAAIQMVTQVDPSVTLNVHWGPIVCLDADSPGPWIVSDPIDSGRYPRKFSVAGIAGTTWPRSNSGMMTDQKEYWAQSSESFVPLIDEAYYQTLAAKTDVTDPTSRNGNPIIIRGTCAGGHPNCGYFIPPPGDTYIFDAGSPGYALTGGPNSAAIYVDGSAEFDRVAIDSAAVIVTGGLTLNDPAGTGTQPNLHVPITAPSEYPYYPATPVSWPCQGQQGHADASNQPLYDCAYGQVFSSHVQFRGFLYVKGNLFLNASAWNMVGSLLVGDMQAAPGTSGKITLDPSATVGDTLTVAYDDGINHSLHVNPVMGTTIKISPDLLRDVSPR